LSGKLFDGVEMSSSSRNDEASVALGSGAAGRGDSLST
jgi:hypothetical protein